MRSERWCYYYNFNKIRKIILDFSKTVIQYVSYLMYQQLQNISLLQASQQLKGLPINADPVCVQIEVYQNIAVCKSLYTFGSLKNAIGTVLSFVNNFQLFLFHFLQPFNIFYSISCNQTIAEVNICFLLFLMVVITFKTLCVNISWFIIQSFAFCP